MNTVTLYNNTTVVDELPVYTWRRDLPMAGGAGGGGGSGSFLYSPVGNSYFLLTGGGSGGTIGPGAGGGSSCSFTLTSFNLNTGKYFDTGNYFSGFAVGGGGGGFNGGIGGADGNSGENVSAVITLSPAITLSGGAYALPYDLTDFSVETLIPFLWYHSGWLNENFGNLVQSAERVVSVRTNAGTYFRSGSGGASAAVGAASALFSTVSAQAAGAAAPSLKPVIKSGTISGFINSSNKNEISTPGVSESNWHSSNNNADNTLFKSTITITIGNAQPGLPGEHGGNNRNSARGDGPGPGESGSLNIYKIFTPLKQQ